MAKLEGKIALVTGGNSAIGLATAKRFVREGAYVFITGRRKAELDAAAKEIGRNVTGVQGDMVEARRPRSPLRPNQAGEGQARHRVCECRCRPLCRLGRYQRGVFDSIFDTNVKGLLFTVQKALPLLPNGASIILNASMVGSKGLATYSVYSATKAAVRSFARTWTTDLKERRIRVNAVSPGSIDTPAARSLLASSDVGEERKKMIADSVPLGRFGTPDETAKAVVFLASDDSS